MKRRNNPDWLLRGSTDLVQDAVRFFGKGSLASGIYMMKHILDNQHPIDLGILCDILDVLCGALIFAQRRRSGSLHELLLPRSWILRVSDRLNDIRHDDMQSLYVEYTSNLLQDVYSGPVSQDALVRSKWAQRFSWSNIVHHISSAYLTRICQNLCLLGFNIPNYMKYERTLSGVFGHYTIELTKLKRLASIDP